MRYQRKLGKIYFNPALQNYINLKFKVLKSIV